MRTFDLNIEKILEAWEPYHAIREIIANAIDEQLLSNTQDIRIWKDEDCNWHIRDYGRGIKYTHLTQNENDEKLNNLGVIGKFGIGLKDALATFDRHNIKVLIRSKYGDISLLKAHKQNFDDIVTLHASIEESLDQQMMGTEVIIENIKDEEVEHGKKLFLRFSGETILDSTKYGQIVKRGGSSSIIYINGVKAAEEENFLFSYNITTLNAATRKALNRERSNVGRTAYTDRVKAILIASESIFVAEALATDMSTISTGTHHDEMSWLDVQERAVHILNSDKKTLFVTSSEIMARPDLVEDGRSSGFRVVPIPDSLKYRIQGQKDIEGNLVMDLSQFVIQYNNSFEYKFIDETEMTPSELKIFKLTDQIFQEFGSKPSNVVAVKISETMRKDFDCTRETDVAWDSNTGFIIVKRSQLSCLNEYAGTLLHEVTHASTGYHDVDRQFESELSSLIGRLCAMLIEEKARKDISQTPSEEHRQTSQKTDSWYSRLAKRVTG